MASSKDYLDNPAADERECTYRERRERIRKFEKDLIPPSMLRTVAREAKKQCAAVVLNILKVFDVKKEMDFDKFSMIDDFIECCQAISTQLQILNESHNKELLDAKDLDETKRLLLEKKEVLLSFYGKYNVGKSTLINALLHNRFLPVSYDAMTSFRLKIQHIFEDISDNASLEDLKNNNTVSGCKEICETLSTENQSVRETKESPNYILKMKIPLNLKVPDGWQVSLVDNPGSDECIAHVREVANQSLKVSCACLYVTTPMDYQDKETASFLQQVYQENNDVFSQRRVIIVVTKLDAASDDCGNIVDDSKIIEKIHKHVLKVCGCTERNIPKDVIIPVYGSYAELARYTKKSDNPDASKLKIIKMLCQLDSQPAGQDEDIWTVLLKKQVSSLCTELEQKSKIFELETRVEELATSSIKIWQQKVYSVYLKYLEDSCAILMKKKDEQEKVVKEKECSCQFKDWDHICGQYQKILELTDEKVKDSVWKAFQDAYAFDSKKFDFMPDIEENVRELIEDFKKKAFVRMKNKEFGPKDLTEDIDKIKEQCSKRLNEKLNDEAYFIRLKECRTQYLNKVSLLICSIASVIETNIDIDAQEAKEGLPELKKFMMDNHSIAAPEVTFTLWEKFLAFVIGAFLTHAADNDDDKHRSVGPQTVEEESLIKEALFQQEDETESIEDSPSASALPLRNKWYPQQLYKKWTDSHDKVLKDFIIFIEKETECFVSNMETEVTEAFWKSFRDLALKKVKEFSTRYQKKIEKEINSQYEVCSSVLEILVRMQVTM